MSVLERTRSDQMLHDSIAIIATLQLLVDSSQMQFVICLNKKLSLKISCSL